MSPSILVGYWNTAIVAVGTSMVISSQSTKVITEDVDKPDVDPTSYRIIELSNGIEVLLGHNANATKSGAAMSVGVGSYSDPDDLPGLAHAVEHFLFMGTKKYPTENNFQQYLAMSGGSYDAHTAATSTTFAFDVAPCSKKHTDHLCDRSPLYDALDRFAQFFIAPLFRADSVKRELQAIENEFKGNSSSDVVRMWMLDKQLASTKHPHHRFTTGNLQTLRDEPKKRKVDIRDRAINFWWEHYSANKMTMALLGRESLDTLQSWVEELFEQIPNYDLAKYTWPDSPLPSGLPILTIAKPLGSGNWLHLAFPYQDEEFSSTRECFPGRYLEYLIGYEGKGSILAAIKAKNYGRTLNATTTMISPGYGLLRISIGITDVGVRAYKEVAQIVFQYLSLIKSTFPSEALCQDIMQCADIEFRFKQRYAIAQFVRDIAERMQMKAMPRKWIIKGSSATGNLSKEEYTSATTHIRADNYRLLLVTQNPPTSFDAKEKWYGTEYHTSSVDSALQDILRKALEGYLAADTGLPLSLPPINEFLPQRLTPISKNDAEPEMEMPLLIRKDDKIHVWWMPCHRPPLPKASLRARIRLDGIATDPRKTVAARIFTKLVTEAMDEYKYSLKLAGLYFNIPCNFDGLTIAVEGFSERLPVLLQRLVDRVIEFPFTEGQFQRTKEILIEEFEEQATDDSTLQASDLLGWLMTANDYKIDRLSEITSNLELKEVVAFHSQVVEIGHIEVLAYGDLTQVTALEVSNNIAEKLCKAPLPENKRSQKQTFVLPKGSNLLWEKTIPSFLASCIQLDVFTGLASNSLIRAQTLLFKHICSETIFDRLRTKEQLAYYLSVHEGGDFNTTGWSIICQSYKDLVFVEQRIESFLVDFLDIILEMPEEEFEGYKQSSIDAILEPRNAFEMRSAYIFKHILTGDYNFLGYKEDIENLRAMTKQSMMEFCAIHVDPRSPYRTKISLHMIPEAGKVTVASTAKTLWHKGRLMAQRFVPASSRSLNLKLTQESGYKSPTLIQDIDSFRSKLNLVELPNPPSGLTPFEAKAKAEVDH